MGSPDNEEGRWDDEGPQHEVAIESGFWMFETPCTQALWEAVMGKNPSRFPGPERPVEQVSWEDVEDFLTRIAAMIPGLRLGLPTEEQWEYACRAGSAAARYGDLDQIAWYSENSGGETHPVALKQPNGWGLHDMLGNVWEWCADEYWEYGTGKSGASAHRVIRGGSWRIDARDVRAAYRNHYEPSYRDSYLGFRCAEFRTPGPVGRKEKQGAERAGERGGVGAEHPGDRDTASGAGWINVDAPGMDAVSFATLTPVRVSSDVEQVVLRTTTRPKVGFGHRSRQVWALGGVHDRGERREAAHETRGQEEERSAEGSTRPRPPAPPLDPAGSVPDGFASRRGRAILVRRTTTRGHDRRRLLDVRHTLHPGALGSRDGRESQPLQGGGSSCGIGELGTVPGILDGAEFPA